MYIHFAVLKDSVFDQLKTSSNIFEQYIRAEVDILIFILCFFFDIHDIHVHQPI